MTPGLQGAENGPMSAYFPDHPLIPKNTCPEGAKTPRVKLIGEVGPLPPSSPGQFLLIFDELRVKQFFMLN